VGHSFAQEAGESAYELLVPAQRSLTHSIENSMSQFVIESVALAILALLVTLVEFLGNLDVAACDAAFSEVITRTSLDLTNLDVRPPDSDGWGYLLIVDFHYGFFMFFENREQVPAIALSAAICSSRDKSSQTVTLLSALNCTMMSGSFSSMIIVD
jgi:hypothetical protein